MDRIIIKEARFMCNVGVSEKEREKKQLVVIDAELFLYLKKASSSDDIKNTVNYSELHSVMKNVAENKRYKLIEAMAENIAKEILNNFSVKKIIVRVMKPSALSKKNVKYAAVEITRARHG